MVNTHVFVLGALAGLWVRFWRYNLRGYVALKTVLVGATSAGGVYYVMPDDANSIMCFITAYLSSQSIGYLKRIKSTSKIKK